MLLMQYNDNIPAVFGFPRVIPHQRRGGTEEDRGRTLLFWPQRAVFVLLAVSLLFIVPPVSTTGTVYLAVCIIEQQHIIVGCFFFYFALPVWLYQFRTCMGKKINHSNSCFLTRGVHYPQSSNTWSPIWPVCVRQEATDGCRRPVHTAPFISWAPQHMAFLRLLLTMGG